MNKTNVEYLVECMRLDWTISKEERVQVGLTIDSDCIILRDHNSELSYPISTAFMKYLISTLPVTETP